MNSKLEDKTLKPMVERALVPTLRFPAFRGAEAWENKELREVATIINEKAGSNKFILMSITAGVGLVSQLAKFGREIAGTQYKNYYVIRNNDFAYNKSATKEYPEGFIGLYSGKENGAVPNSIFTCFRADENSVIPKYLDYLFVGNLHGKWLRKFITVGARAHGSLNIDNNDLLALPVPFPRGDASLAEQKKIAECLSSIDELITLNVQKFDTLKAHKNGLMRQLFPTEGETLPKLRFPEFRNAVDWEFIPLNALAKRCTQKNRDEKIKRVLTNSAEFGVVDQRDYFDKDIATQGNLGGYFIVEKGDYVYNPRISATAPVGPISKNNIATGVMSPLYTVFRFTNSDNDFYAYYLKSTGWHHYMRQVSSTGARHDRMAITNDNFMAMPIPVASSEKEQQKIADCIASIDDLITLAARNLDTLKTHKKGLMQQLFPTHDEVNI